jgi:hypothetical protein
MECTKKVSKNKLNPTTYMFFEKTIWKNFFPREGGNDRLPANSPHTVVYCPQVKRRQRGKLMG